MLMLNNLSVYVMSLRCLRAATSVSSVQTPLVPEHVVKHAPLTALERLEPVAVAALYMRIAHQVRTRICKPRKAACHAHWPQTFRICMCMQSKKMRGLVLLKMSLLLST